MKTPRLSHRVKIIASSVILFLGPLASGAAENAFPAGSFDPDTDPTAVMTASYGWGTYATVVEEDGEHYLRITRPAGEQTGAWVRAKVPLDPEWKRVKLSLRARVSVEATGPESYDKPKVFLQLRNAEDKQVIPWPGEFAFGESTDGWEYLSKTIVLGDGAASLGIEITFQGQSAGVIEVDDIVVEPVG